MSNNEPNPALPTADAKTFLTIKEAARASKMGPELIREAIASGDLTAWERLGGLRKRTFITVSSFRRWTGLN